MQLGALEGQHFKKTGVLVQLSAQNLIDCSKSQGNYGCSGGLATSSYKYIRDNMGVDTKKYYPYKGVVSRCPIEIKVECTWFVFKKYAKKV